jgi:S-(hydroxymethyl)glutathione dehydrogenase/alcohol dehydrogenase
VKPTFSDIDENLAGVLLAKHSVAVMGLNDPALTAHQVRVRMQTSAVCGTQLGEWNQTRGPDPYLPHCFGHEAVGRVLEVGRAVEGLAVGDRVVVSWMKTPAKSDGPPKFVRASDGTVVNFGECCTFLRRGVFPANRVVKIDDAIDDGAAALLGCAYLTAFAALKQTTRNFTRTGEEIAIVGAGGIGLSAALLAKAHGLKATCIDLPKVVDALKAEGLDIDLLSTAEAAATRGHSFPLVIICAGAPAAFELGEQLLPKNAGAMYIVGNPPTGVKVGFDVKPLLYGREIVGVGEKDVRLPEDMYALIDLIKRGRLDAGKLVRRTFPLSQLQSALEVTNSGLGGRTLIEID